MTRSLIFACALAIASTPAVAQAQRIKLGTLAPNGSAWYEVMKDMGQKWSEASGGKVKLVIYPGGVLGDEGDLVGKMRIGQVQAAALTSVGLHEIAPDPQVLDVPMMIDSFSTLDYVMQRIAPKLEAAVAARGYVVLNWSEVGFVRFFSTRRYDSIAEMQRRAKVFTWAGDPASADAWRAGGFHPVVLSATDIAPSLSTGLIDTVAMAPLYAFTSRAFERARYMTDVPWAVLTGAIVVKKEAWEKISPELRSKLLAISRDSAKRLSVEVRRMDAEAMTQMKAQGLVVVTPTDTASSRKTAELTWSVIRGRVVPEAIFDEVARLAQDAHLKRN